MDISENERQAALAALLKRNELLAQSILGTHVEAGTARLFIRPQDKDRMLIAGVLLTNSFPAKPGTDEMWECDVILIPRRRWRSAPELGRYRIDQVLCGGYEREKMYQETISVEKNAPNSKQKPKRNQDYWQDDEL